MKRAFLSLSLGIVAVLAMLAFISRAEAATGSWSLSGGRCDKKGTSGSCSFRIGAFGLQAWKGEFVGWAEGHGGFGGAGGVISANACLSWGPIMWTGSCWSYPNATIGDGPGFANIDGNIKDDISAPFGWWIVSTYANDATWDPVNLTVHGRGVSIDSFDASLSEVEAGGTVSLSWTTDWAVGGVRLFWDGPVSCPVSSGGAVSDSGSISCIAQNPGTAYFTISAAGPTNEGVKTISADRQVGITRGSAQYVDLNFTVKDVCNSAPVAGAEVRISRDFGNGTSRRTDGSGFANFGVFRDTQVDWSVSRAGYSGASGSVNTDGGVGTVISLQRDCASPPGRDNGEEEGPPTHKQCQGFSCVVVEGEGPNVCETDSDCGPAFPGARYGCDWDYGVCRQMDNGPYDAPDCGGRCPQGPALNYRCLDNTCYQADDGPYRGLASCLEACGGLPAPPPPPSYRNACTNDGACVRVRGSGPNQCSDPGNLDSSNCAQPAPSCQSFTSSPKKLVYPPAKGVTLSWTCTKAHFGCTIRDNNPDAPDIGDVPQSGARDTPALAWTTDYVLQCQGRGGPSPEYHLPLGALRVYQFTGGKLREIAP